MLNPNVALAVIGASCDGIDPPQVALHPATKAASGTTTRVRRPKRRPWNLLITPPEADHFEDPRTTSSGNVSRVLVSARGCPARDALRERPRAGDPGAPVTAA